MNLFKILFTALMLSISIYGQGNWIKVKIIGIEEIKGQMAIALFNSSDNFPEQKGDNPHAFVEINSDSVEHTFYDIADGVYAIAVYHDANSNGEMDKNFLGIPTEDYVFSNYASGSFGPPEFEEAVFKFEDTLIITLDINK